MRLFIAIFALLNFHVYALALNRKSPYIAVTPHVLGLTSSPFRYPLTPSSNYLTKRFDLVNSAASVNITATQADDDTIAEIQEGLLTLGGRVYMTNITLAQQPYTLVIDTGSSDTWIASEAFQCQARTSRILLPQSSCGFGKLYNPDESATYVKIASHDFGVSYTDGEYLSGEMGTEELEIGGLETRQTIGVVERGWWLGDGISSGLMGLGYSTLASNVRDLNYTSVIFSLFDDGSVPPVFSLALQRPSRQAPRAGGLLAIGGIPNIPYEDDFVSVPIQPIMSTTYAFYSIPVDGFSLIPPPKTTSPLENIQLPQPHSRWQRSNHKLSFRQANASSFSKPKPSSGQLEMVIDSGTTLMYLPDNVADTIASQFNPPARYIGFSNLYMVECNAQAPKLGVIIGGKTFLIAERDLLNNEGFGGPGSMCVVTVQRQGKGDAVLGDSFLKNVVVVFDLGENEIRLAARMEE